MLPATCLLLASSGWQIGTTHVDDLRRVYEVDHGPCFDALESLPDTYLLVFNEAWYAAHVGGSHGDRFVVATPAVEHLERALVFARARGLGAAFVTSGRRRRHLAERLPPGATRLAHCAAADVYRITAQSIPDGDVPPSPYAR